MSAVLHDGTEQLRRPSDLGSIPGEVFAFLGGEFFVKFSN